MKKALLVVLLILVCSIFFPIDVLAYGYNSWFCENCHKENDAIFQECNHCHASMPPNIVDIYIGFKENIFFSKYDLDVYLDNKLICVLKHGENMARTYRMSSKKHTIAVTKHDDKTVYQKADLSVTTNGKYYWHVETKRDGIHVRKPEWTAADNSDPYELVFEIRVKAARYYLYFDMDTNKFFRKDKYNRTYRGTFTGSFNDMVVLHYSEGTTQTYKYVVERKNSESHLYPVLADGTLFKQGHMYHDWYRTK